MEALFCCHMCVCVCVCGCPRNRQQLYFMSFMYSLRETSITGSTARGRGDEKMTSGERTEPGAATVWTRSDVGETRTLTLFLSSCSFSRILPHGHLMRF